MNWVNGKDWISAATSVVGSVAFLAVIYGCGCGKKGGGGFFPPPEPPQAEVETATAGQIAASIPPTAEPIAPLAGGDDPNVKPEDQKSKPGGREVASAATAKDRPNEDKKPVANLGGNNGSNSSLPNLPQLRAGSLGKTTEVKSETPKIEGNTNAADEKSNNDGLAATEGNFLPGSGDGYEGVGSGSASGAEKKSANPFAGIGAGEAVGSNFGGPESANFGAGGPNAPSDGGVINGGQGDLDAYLARVGHNSLFDVVSKRYDKWGNQIEADRMRADLLKTANQ